MVDIQKMWPSPALQPYVLEYMYMKVIGQPTGQEWSRSFPAPVEQVLIFYLTGYVRATYHNGLDKRASKSNLVGQPVHQIQLSSSADLSFFMIRFQPTGFFRLFGVPQDLFTDVAEDVTLVLGADMQRLREQIENATTSTEMVIYAERFLLHWTESARRLTRPIDYAIGQMFTKNTRPISLDQLASDACLSPRQFERCFMERVGVTPKLYARLIRFNRALQYKQTHPHESWLQVAFATGYFDHAHLIRDFKLFAGVSPTDRKLQESLTLLAMMNSQIIEK